MRWVTAAIALLALLLVAALILEAAGAAPAAWGHATVWLLEQQRAFHQALTEALRAIADRPSASTAFWLVAASFLYGVFHAAGPGHGKLVLTGWLVARHHRLGRGVSIAIASAFVQGLVAVAIVYGLVDLAGLLPRETSTAVDWSERASFALVALIGAALVARTAAGILRRPSPHAGHGHEAGCGHLHVPSLDQIDRAAGAKAVLGVVLSIGLRPCAGAIVVLVFARVLDMPWTGVFAVAAMSAGTAATVAALAAMAVVLRDRVRAVAGPGGRSLAVTSDLLALAGGIILITVGLSLLTASFAPAHPLRI